MKLPALFRSRRTQPPAEVDAGFPGVQERYYTFTDFFKADPFYWQKGLDMVNPGDVATNTAVYSCVNILSQEVASLRVQHWRVDDRGVRTLVVNSNPMRVLRRPNEYQTSSDFWLYMMRSLGLRGTAFAAAERNRKTEVSALHPLPTGGCRPMVSADNSQIFYNLSDFGDNLFDVDSTVPARNVFNPRINCFRHPLLGETPITAFAYAGAAGNSIQRASSKFFSNLSRPSGVLTTPRVLTTKQLDELKARWDTITRGDYIGGTPVLHGGLKWDQVTMSATDAEMIKAYDLSVSDVAMAYRIPLFMLGDLSKATFRNVETLFRVFYTSSLRFYLEHLENHLNRLFELDGDTEYLEFDIEGGLLRGDLDTRIDALTKGVQGGLYTPNEARKREELPPLAGGNDLFLQRQMVPVSKIGDMLEAEAKKAATPPPEPPAPMAEEDMPEDEEPVEDDTAARLYAIEQRQAALEKNHSDSQTGNFSEMLLQLNAMVVKTNGAPQRHVVNVSAPVSVAPTIDTTEIAEALRAMQPHSITLAPNIMVPAQERTEPPIVNVAAPVVNVTAPEMVPAVVNVSVPQQDPPVVNVTVPEQRAPVVNVAVPKQDPPVVNVAAPEQRAPVVNVAVPSQAAPIVNVAVPKQEAPVVNVTTPEVRVEVPAAEPPVVNITPTAAINVQIPEQDTPVVNVQVPRPRVRKTKTTFKRDARGELTESETQEIDEDE